MTGRERLDAILHKQPADRLAWTTLVTRETFHGFPAPYCNMDEMTFYRAIGCDVFLMSGLGNGVGFSNPTRALESSFEKQVRVENYADGDSWVSATHLPGGTLRSVSRHGHPVKYAVASKEDLLLYRELWEHTFYQEQADAAGAAALDVAVGEDGVVVCPFDPSTIPMLLEMEMGMENFYYLLEDYPDEMEALFGCIRTRRREAYRSLARGAFNTVMLIENTSTRYISPEIYETYSAPEVAEFVEIMHAAGKSAIIHMCGHIRDLLPHIRETGLDGIHALTPPPTGDTPWELALDAIGEDLVIIGCFDPTVFVRGTPAEIQRALTEAYTPRLRAANFVLCPFADGIQMPVDNFLAVAKWFDQQA